MSHLIRLAQCSEAPQLARLHVRTARRAFAEIFPPDAPPPTYDDELAHWEQWLAPEPAGTRGRRVFVAEDDADGADAGADADPGGGLVGVVLAGPDPTDGGVGHLARLYVDPERWGRGIGRQLYEAAIEHMVEACYPEATLWVLEANSRARSWYERLGWTLTGARKPTYAPASIDDVGYRLVLRR